MELSGKVIKVFEEIDKGDFKERIIRIKSYVKDQILDIYVYNKLSFRCGFLMENEEVIFSIILRGVEAGERQQAIIVSDKIIKPNLELTKDHPIVDVEWIRKDSRTPK